MAVFDKCETVDSDLTTYQAWSGPLSFTIYRHKSDFPDSLFVFNHDDGTVLVDMTIPKISPDNPTMKYHYGSTE